MSHSWEEDFFIFQSTRFYFWPNLANLTENDPNYPATLPKFASALVPVTCNPIGDKTLTYSYITLFEIKKVLKIIIYITQNYKIILRCRKGC